MKKLGEVRLLLSGKYPKGAKLEELLDEALEALLDKHSPERREMRRKKRREAQKSLREKAASNYPRPDKEPGRHIPLQVRDAVFRRDGGRCAFIGEDGRRCDERHDVEVHHLKPFSISRSHELENLALRCRVHNVYEAVLDFGRGRMGRFGWLPSTSEVNCRT